MSRLGVEDTIIALLNRCWDDEPEERPDDARDLAERIAALRGKSPVAETDGDSSGGKLESTKKVEAGSIWENSLKMKFVGVPAGSFWMGGGGRRLGDRQVPIPHDFHIGMYPVTQAAWHAVMGNNPSHFARKGDGRDKVKGVSNEELRQFPVETVSWDDVQKFIENLNAREKNSGLMYRLPTEAEWEYSCRGGAASKEACSYHFYLDQPTNTLSSTVANFDGRYPDGGAGTGPYLERTTRVGSYKSNALGIHDMHGNVWEWCNDLWEGGPGRVGRGGTWKSNGQSCRSAHRFKFAPPHRRDDLGFRLALVPSGDPSGK